MNGVRKVPEENLHPTIREFKVFINQHPKLIEEIRKSGRSWQEYYEKWVLLGEDDPMWAQYKDASESKVKSENKTDWIRQVMKLTENVDMNKVQEQVNQLSGTVTTLQEILGNFQQKEDTNPKPLNDKRQFRWFKD